MRCVYSITTALYYYTLKKNNVMKITIHLTDIEVKALKTYLKEVSRDVNPIISKDDIKDEIQGIVNSSLQAGAVGDYLQQFLNLTNEK